MDALDALFDGLEAEMKPTHDFYFHTHNFRDPVQSGGQREWNLLLRSFKNPAWESNGIVRGVRDIYLKRMSALLHADIEKVDCPYDETARAQIMAERRMVLQDCMDCLRTTKKIIASFSDMSGNTYQENVPVMLTDFSDEHIPMIKLMEAQSYDDGISGTDLAELFRTMKIKNRLHDKFEKPHPAHFRVAVHPVKTRQVYGYLFTDATRKADSREHTYEPHSGHFTRKRHITKLVTMGARPDVTQRVMPELLSEALKHMDLLKCDRLEDRTNEYHRKG